MWVRCSDLFGRPRLSVDVDEAPMYDLDCVVVIRIQYGVLHLNTILRSATVMISRALPNLIPAQDLPLLSHSWKSMVCLRINSCHALCVRLHQSLALLAVCEVQMDLRIVSSKPKRLRTMYSSRITSCVKTAIGDFVSLSHSYTLRFRDFVLLPHLFA